MPSQASSEHTMRASAIFTIAVVSAACGGGGDTGPTGNGGPKPVTSIQIDGAKSTFLVGESAQLTALPLDASGTVVSGAPAVTWESSTPAVATVGTDGTVQAVSVGSSSIKANIGSINATRVVNVLPVGVGAIVTMPGLNFAPFTATISRDQAVFFDFPALGHNVIFTQRAGAPLNIDVSAQVTISRPFATPGTFPYECTIHTGMRGEVVVTP